MTRRTIDPRRFFKAAHPIEQRLGQEVYGAVLRAVNAIALDDAGELVTEEEFALRSACLGFVLGGFQRSAVSELLGSDEN